MWKICLVTFAVLDYRKNPYCWQTKFSVCSLIQCFMFSDTFAHQNKSLFCVLEVVLFRISFLFLCLVTFALFWITEPFHCFCHLPYRKPLLLEVVFTISTLFLYYWKMLYLWGTILTSVLTYLLLHNKCSKNYIISLLFLLLFFKINLALLRDFKTHSETLML